MKVLKEGETPTVNERGDYNEYIPLEMGFKEDWPVGMLKMDIRPYLSPGYEMLT